MPDISLLSAAFYAYFGVGSVAIGYLLLRMTYPEIRTMDFNIRLGISALSGLLLSVAAFALDYSYDSADVMTRSGFFPLVLFLLLAASFVVLKVYFVLSQSTFLTIGIPMAASIAIPAVPANAAARTAPKPAAGAAPTPPIEPPVAYAPSQPAALKATPLTAPPADFAPIELDFSRLQKTAPKQAFTAASPQQAQPRPAQAAAGPRAAAVQKTQAASPQAAVPSAPKPPSSTKPAAVPPAAGVAPMPSAGVSGNVSQAQQEPSAQEKRRVILKLRQEDSYLEKPPKPSLFSRLFGWMSPAPKPRQSMQPAPQQKGMQLPKTLLKAPQVVTAKGVNGQLIASQSKPTPPSASLAKPINATPPLAQSAASAAAQKATPPAGEENPPKGFMATIDAIIAEKQAHQPAQSQKSGEMLVELPVAEAFKAAPAAQPPNRGFVTYRTLAKTGAAQAVRQAPPSPEDAEAEEMAKDLAAPASKPAVASAAVPQSVVRRRYMASSGGVEQKDVDVIVQKQAADKQEFDSLVSDVYYQLKENQKPTGLRSALSVNAPPKAAKPEKKTGEKKPPAKHAGEEPKPEITFEDLVGTGKPQPSATPAEGGDASSVFAKLRSLSSPRPQPPSKIEFVKVEAEKGMGCPTCHSKSSRIIFCPYCGSGMCANCSPKIRPLPEQIAYTCPKCSEETLVNKKRP